MPDKTIGREAGESRRDNYVIIWHRAGGRDCDPSPVRRSQFSDEKSVDVNVAPPSTEAPATGETPKP
jgi:hypothetical protein